MPTELRVYCSGKLSEFSDTEANLDFFNKKTTVTGNKFFDYLPKEIKLETSPKRSLRIFVEITILFCSRVYS
jgi:hypothetical protein